MRDPFCKRQLIITNEAFERNDNRFPPLMSVDCIDFVTRNDRKHTGRKDAERENKVGEQNVPNALKVDG